MKRVGPAASIALIAMGVWLVWWYDPRFRSDSVPWGGMCAISLGLIGLAVCVLARLTGSDLTIGPAPERVLEWEQPNRPTTRKEHPQ